HSSRVASGATLTRHRTSSASTRAICASSAPFMFASCFRVLSGATGLKSFSLGAIEEGAGLVRARMEAQLAQGFHFNLADALASKGECLAHFLERVLTTIVQTKAHLDDLFL